ncbi:RNA polymerase sigma factor [Pseudoalteromonas fenneropenaei]
MLNVQNGALNCLAPLFERYKVRLFNFFRRTGYAAEISEDLVQETFMRVLAYRSSYQGESAFSTWLYGIARNVGVDHYRRNKVSAQHESFDDDTASSLPTLEEDLLHHRQQAMFDQALSSIPHEHRELLVLSRFQQLKYEEIAKVTDCNLSTLKSRMVKAVELLQAAYQRLNCGHKVEEDK